MSLSIGIIGFGNHGEFLLNACRRVGGLEVHWIYRPDRPVALDAARRYGVRAAESYEQILHDPSIDAVFIASPSHAHRQQCEAALKAGKHVLVEKPLADSLEDAQAIVAAAQKSDRLVMVDHCERFNPAFIDAKKIVADGAIGRLRAIQSNRMSPLHLNDPTWRLGVLDTAVHNIDLICWLFDAAPVAVSARSCRVSPDLPIDDQVWLSMAFDGGARAEDHIGWVPMDRYLMPVAHPRFLLLGTEGFYEVDLTRRAGLLYRGDFSRYTDDVLLGFSEDYLSTMGYTVWHFARAIERGGASPIPPADALRAMSVALAARRSIEAGGSPVPISNFHP